MSGAPRIASVAYWDAFADDGVAAKLRGQVEAWRRDGAEATLLVLSPRPTHDRPPVVGDVVVTFGSARERVRATRALAAAVRALEPDVVYLRSDLFVPPVSARTFGGAPLVVELNTLDRVEVRGRSLRARLWFGLNRRRLLGTADGVVGVTEEIVADALAERPGLAAAVVPNGVDPGTIPSLPAPANDRPRIAFLGSPGLRWHGVDKLVELARLRPDWDVDVIGFDRDQLGDPPPNLVAYGFLPREEYLQVLARADVAAGTLALHRKGMEEACPLKTPEYLLAGLPVIVGYRDPSFADVDPWYLLRLPNTEDNVVSSIDRIEAWLGAVRGRRVPREEVEPRVSLVAKEAERLAFLRSVSGGGGIRTHGGVAPSTVFKTAPFDRSGTPPTA